jgi:hypothetical protein
MVVVVCIKAECFSLWRCAFSSSCETACRGSIHLSTTDHDMTQRQWAYSSPSNRLDTFFDPSIAPPQLLPALVVSSLVIVLVVIAVILKSDSMQGIGMLALERVNSAFKKTNDSKLFNGDLQAAAAVVAHEEELDDEQAEARDDLKYPGLLNTSTTCYLNSTLQSLASCSSFIAYLQSLIDSSDIHLELTNSLLLMLRALNQPSKYGKILRTEEILRSLINSSSTSNANKNRRRIMQGSGQQDAQEFFLILAETVEEEKKVLFEKLQKKREEKVGLRELLLPVELLDTLNKIVRPDNKHFGQESSLIVITLFRVATTHSRTHSKL